MKRALFLCPSPFEVGTYFRAHAFARYLKQQQLFDVDLICTAQASLKHGFRYDSVSGVNVIQTAYFGPNLTPMRGWNTGELYSRWSYLRASKRKYDLIYSFEYQPSVSLFGFWKARELGVRHFNDWCDWYAGRHHRMGGIRVLQRIDAWMEEFPRKRVECVTTICDSLFQRALASGVPRSRLLMLREGADEPKGMKSREEARQSLGLGRGEFLVIAMHDQEVDVLKCGIEVLAAKRPGSRLVLIGKFPGSVRQSALIEMPGRVSDEALHLWLCAADCAWLPLEDSELNRGRLPHKIGHFRMYGLPLVTTAVSDVVQIRDPGIIFADFSGASFGQVTGKLCSLTDEARAMSMQEARKHFSWDRILEPLARRLIETPVAKA